MNKAYAIKQALNHGASLKDIEKEASLQLRHVRTMPFKNMVIALTITSRLNDKYDWTRLASALLAKSKNKERVKK